MKTFTEICDCCGTKLEQEDTGLSPVSEMKSLTVSIQVTGFHAYEIATAGDDLCSRCRTKAKAELFELISESEYFTEVKND